MTANPLPQSVAVVAGRDQVAVHALAGGAPRGHFPAPGGNTDIQMTAAGIAILNNTGADQLVIIDAARVEEVARIPSSALGGTRPVHAYLSPVLGGRQYFVALNDGVAAQTPLGSRPADSTMTLLDVTPGGPGYLRPVGEARLGRGHHKAGFSMRRPRVAVSGIADPDDVITILDFSDPERIVAVRRFGAQDFGQPAGSLALAPHGTGSSAATGEVFHFLTGTGQVAIIDIDAEIPTLRLLQTSGIGGNSVKDLPGGRFMVVAQRTPRECGLRADGQLGQVGQLVVLDAAARAVVAQVPILHDGPDGMASLAGTDAALASPSYPVASPDGKTLFVQLGTIAPPSHQAGSIGIVASSAIAVFDIADPRRPRQLPSIAVGRGAGPRELALSGNGRLLLAADGLDDSISVVGVAERRVLHRFATVAAPVRLATFGPDGPSKPAGPANKEVP